MYFVRAFCVVLSIVGFASALCGQDLKPGRLPSDVRKSLVPGVLAEYFAADDQLLDSQVVRLPAVLLNEKESVTPFVQDRNIKIRFSGFLKLKLKGAYRFSLVGNGKLELRLNNEEVLNGAGDLAKLKPVEVDLVKGYNRLEVVFTPPATGTAKLRIYWQNEAFKKEPVPAIVFLNSAEENCLKKSAELAAAIRQNELVHNGRNLVLRHNCLKCHEAESLSNVFKQRDTPDLKLAAGRLNSDWIEDWLAQPKQMRNSTSMPRLLDPDDKKGIADLTAYVISLSQEDSAQKLLGDATQGGDTFENLGCIGCHHFEQPDFEDEYQRVSLFYAGAKFKTGRMAEFLRDSRAHYQWSRMPQFRLSETQCQDLESFIRSESKGKAVGVEAGNTDIENGKKLFGQTGCANCHQVTQAEQPAKKIKPWDQLASQAGCLSPQSDKEGQVIPDFQLEESDVVSIRRFLDSDSKSAFANVSRSYFTSRTMKEMRCTTCHDLDDDQATLPYILEEEGVVGLPPNRVPMLTYAGEKLLPSWSEKLIAGKLGYRVREHFRVQMPGFPVRASWLAPGMSAIHGFAGDENEAVDIKDSAVKSGAAVAAMETGLSCNRCHAIADKKPNAAFDAQSTNLIYAAKRLRKEYYMRWMFDPIRIDKQTKMPRFSEDGKSTSLKTVFEGDAQKQFDALWHYLNKIKAK